MLATQTLINHDAATFASMHIFGDCHMIIQPENIVKILLVLTHLCLVHHMDYDSETGCEFRRN